MEILDQSLKGIKRAGELIRKGKLVIWPSDIWYGLATTALSQDAVNKIYEVKRRSRDQGFVVITSKEDVEKYGYLNECAKKLIEEFWPGPISIGIYKSNIIPDYVTSGRKTVLLFHMEGLPTELYKSAGVPIISTSANISKDPPVISVEEAIELNKKMDNKIDAIIKGKKSLYNRPTTTIDPKFP